MLSSSFLAQLTQLKAPQQSLFCLSLWQRMSPNYQLFCQALDLDLGAGMDKVLRLAWEATIHPQTKFNAESQFEKFQDVIPDPERYDFYGVYPALDCCVVAECYFNSLLDAEPDLAEQASQTSMASVLGFIEMQHGDLADEQLIEQALVQEEIAFQQSLLQEIQQLKENKAGFQALQSFAFNQGCSNLGIALD